MGKETRKLIPQAGLECILQTRDGRPCRECEYRHESRQGKHNRQLCMFYGMPLRWASVTGADVQQARLMR